VELLTIPVGPLQANCHVLWERQDAALVIDPGDEADRILATLRSKGLRPALLVTTHGHFDHIGAVKPLQEALRVPYKVHRGEVEIMAMVPARTRLWGILTPEAPTPDGFLEPGERLSLGGLEVTALHTPGHTPGSTSFHVPRAKAVFTGDTLFAGSIGRTDFPGGDTETELRSIRERLLTLPPETRVHPGHGPSSTIGEEAESNPFLA
jgi:hydroxyacylglutathione hydrolase